MMQKPSILLNGASSAGKSSVSQAIIDLDPSFFHFELDGFLKIAAQKGHCLATEWPYLREVFVRRASIDIAMSKSLIIDTVCTPPGTPFGLFDRLREQNEVFLVGLKPPICTLYNRSQNRKDRMFSLKTVLLQENQVHQGMLYDYQIDNANLTAIETASQIMQAYQQKYDL